MSALPGIQFGAGIVFATPSGGNEAANPTPQEVGIMQNIKLTVGGDIKELYGQFQWPVDTAIGKRNIKGSFEFAQMDNMFFSQLFFADAITTGIIATQYREAHTIPATPFMVTIVPPSSGTFVSDEGVINSNTGIPFVLHATPTTGQYSVNLGTGVYTFAAADTLLPITISYTYTVAAVGTTLTVGNHVMGYGPIVSLNIPFLYQGNVIGWSLPNVRLGKIDVATKLDDYTMLTTDFSAFAGAGGNPLTLYNFF